MKLDINNPLHAEMLAKYLGGEMPSPERQEFESYIEADESNSKLVRMLEKSWKNLDHGEVHMHPDSHKAWKNVYSRFQEENMVPVTKKVLRRSNSLIFVGLAAGLLLLISLGIYFMKENSVKINKEEMQQVQTGDESSTLVKTLGDGSIIYISKNSNFMFPAEFSDESRLVKLEGEAFFDIQADPDKPFIIDAGESMIEVIGTAFTVKTTPGSGMEVVVDRGKVKVSLKKQPDKSELAIAGEKVMTSGSELVKSSASSPGVQGWYKQRMHFKDESLTNILNVLNRNFNAKLVTATPNVGNKRLTVTFDNHESVEMMTELICLSLNLDSRLNGESIMFSERK